METFRIIMTIILTIIIFLILFTMFLYWFINFLIEQNKKKKAIVLKEFSQNPEKHKIVFLGDSLTDFYPLEEFFRGVSIYNRGIAGDTTDNVLARLEETVYPLEPKTVFLQIGTNDYLKRKPNSYIFNNIVKIITNLYENVPGVTINLISLYPVNIKAFVASFLFVGPRKNREIIELNKMLEKYASENNIQFINVYPHLLDVNNCLAKKYTIEGLHLSYEGYITITKLLSEYVNEATKK